MMKITEHSSDFFYRAVNTPTDTRVTTAPLVAPESQFMITMVFVGAAIIASLAAIFFKFKPVPAC
ncbi:MAG: hypothetical protein ACTSSE_06080 [Candidatus Thorarchaeota archaeon]